MGYGSDILNSDQGRFILGNLVSTEDDLGDISHFQQLKNPTSATEYTLLDVTDGPKTLLSGRFAGDYFRDTAATGGGVIGPVTIDGNTVDVYPRGVTSNYFSYVKSSGGYTWGDLGLTPIRYDSSLKIEWEHTGTGNHVSALAFILGSGPHSIAVVKDGEPVYMQATNLSERAIESIDVPEGYKIVENPEIAHPEPQTRGMWDDDKGEVVDHPYLKPFHEKLDELRRLAKFHSEEKVISKVKGHRRLPEDVETDWLLPEDFEARDPEADAVEWWLKTVEEERSGLNRLDNIL